MSSTTRGPIEYLPDCVAPAAAARGFAILCDNVPWRRERRVMYEREVDVPRQVASLDLHDRCAPPAVPEAAQAVEEATALAFNSVGLNFYRNGQDSVAPHSDRLNHWVRGSRIVLLSLGGARRITISAKDRSRPPLHIALEPGSVLIIDYASQRHWLHGIPKQRHAVGPCISLAFRMRPETTD